MSEVRAINGRMRNRALYSAAQKLGGIGRLAKHLGLTCPITSAMINLRWSPDVKRIRAEGKERWSEIERKLCALTGLLLEDIFPEELEPARTAEAPLLQLTDAPRTLSLPPAQEDGLLKEDLRAMITAALAELDEREQEVIELRFGLNGEEAHTLDEVGVRLGVTCERARQIEAKALGRLRHPMRAKKLKPFYGAV
jgi:RNA polymerase sigma factor (sigma-70 family)